MLVNNQWITEEIKEEISNYLEANDNKETTMQNLCNAAKISSKRKVYSILAYLNKQEKSQIKNPTLHLKQLEKEQNPKLSEGNKS